MIDIVNGRYRDDEDGDVLFLSESKLNQGNRLTPPLHEISETLTTRVFAKA